MDRLTLTGTSTAGDLDEAYELAIVDALCGTANDQAVGHWRFIVLELLSDSQPLFSVRAIGTNSLSG